MSTQVSASILAAWDASNGNLQQVLTFAHTMSAAGAWLHVDIMDGIAVPTRTFGAEMVATLHQAVPQAVLDVHLMVANPQEWLHPVAQAGAQRVVFHASAAGEQTATCLHTLRGLGVAGGLALNVDEPSTQALAHAAQLQHVVVMTVQAGAGGQTFQPEMLEKVRQLKHLPCPVGVDGGINAHTAKAAQQAGAKLLIAGSYLQRGGSVASLQLF